MLRLFSVFRLERRHVTIQLIARLCTRVVYRQDLLVTKQGRKQTGVLLGEKLI